MYNDRYIKNKEASKRRGAGSQAGWHKGPLSLVDTLELMQEHRDNRKVDRDHSTANPGID